MPNKVLPLSFSMYVCVFVCDALHCMTHNMCLFCGASSCTKYTYIHNRNGLRFISKAHVPYFARIFTHSCHLPNSIWFKYTENSMEYVYAFFYIVWYSSLRQNGKRQQKSKTKPYKYFAEHKYAFEYIFVVFTRFSPVYMRLRERDVNAVLCKLMPFLLFAMVCYDFFSRIFFSLLFFFADVNMCKCLMRMKAKRTNWMRKSRNGLCENKTTHKQNKTNMKQTSTIRMKKCQTH